jgi:hypothetical protein
MLGTMAKAKKPTSYRVDQTLPTGGYGTYTSPHGVGFSMAESLAAHLKKHGTGGRIVELPSGNVIEEWAQTGERKSPSAARDAIQALREKHFPTTS